LNDGVADAEKVAACFANCFIEATPAGVICGKNDEQFRQAIPQGYDFYKSAGITAMDITGKEITQLDEHHAMARIHWRSLFTRKNGITGGIDFDVIYFLQDLGNGLKIFAYITGDEKKALRDSGLI